MTIRGGELCVAEYVITIPGPEAGSKNETPCRGTMHRALHGSCDVVGGFRQAMVLGGKCGCPGAPGQRGGGGGGRGGPAARRAAAGGPYLREPGVPGSRPPAGGGYDAGPDPAVLSRRRGPGEHTCPSLCTLSPSTAAPNLNDVVDEQCASQFPLDVVDATILQHMERLWN